ncbi:hypothetical protein PIB30_063255 [Stylosanthes scabra]|uniref:Secreted protein n=1 Tax=Stylosanthes scabra TaxID=79078 RepID=A0ABU6ZK31_9FABA|nr:hypothetical protein [Stylosanthes scabra]
MACCLLASSSALFRASEASAASRVCLFKSSLKVASFSEVTGACASCYSVSEVPTDGANVKVGSLTIVQRTLNWGPRSNVRDKKMYLR